MKTLTAVTTAAAALSMACAAATGPQSLPQDASISRITSAHVDVGSMRSSDALMTVLPRTLARYGYFIVKTEARTPDGYRFLTDWQVGPATQEERFSTQQMRTRLVVEARRRGTRYAVSIFADSYVEDEFGGWRKAAFSRDMHKHVQEIGTQLALDVK